MAANIIPSTKPMLGGMDASSGTGGLSSVVVGGSWVLGETFLIVLNRALTSQVSSLGSGLLTGKVPTYLLTYGNKLNLLFGNTWAYSTPNNPTVFNDPNALGNGFVLLADSYSEAQDSVAIAPFQGKLALFGTNHIQIWQVDADPANYQLIQVLDNIGAIAKLSVKSFGELDVFFLHTTGIRSLRVRDASSNGMTIDIGSAIDSLVQAKVIAASATERAAACGVMDTNNSQYWLFLKDTIYVLSHFPGAKISAWSTWKPTYQNANVMRFRMQTDLTAYVKLSMSNDVTKAFYEPITPASNGDVITLVPGMYLFLTNSDGVVLYSTAITDGLLFRGDIRFNGSVFTFTSNQVAFTPQKFATYNGQVFASTSEAFYVYGGADRDTYDNTICAYETSWLDFDSPANDKNFHGVDVAQTGSWNHYGSSDYLSQVMQEIMRSEANATFAGGKIGWTNTGTHAKYRMQTDGTAAKAVVSNLLIHYTGSKQK